MDKNDNIKKASEELKQVSGDYELRRIAELKEKYIRDEHARMAYATEKGLKEGFDKGIEQEQIRIVKNMLDLNFGLDIISKTTGLAEDVIIQLKESNC